MDPPLVAPRHAAASRPYVPRYVAGSRPGSMSNTRLCAESELRTRPRYSTPRWFGSPAGVVHMLDEQSTSVFDAIQGEWETREVGVTPVSWTHLGFRHQH